MNSATIGKKPKIALMSYSMDNRFGKGTALYARRLIEQLIVDESFDWYLVHFDKVDDPLYKKANEILMPELPRPFNRRFFRTMLFFWRYRKKKFAIIHWFQPRLYPFFWFAPAEHIVVTAHGGGDVIAPGIYPFSRRMFNFVMIHFNRTIHAIIADSEYGKEEVVEHYRAESGRVHVTYLGGGENYRALDKGASQAIIARTYGVAPPFILDISRLTPHKNIDTLLKAYDLFRARGRTEKLVIVGGDAGPYSAKMRAEAALSPYARDIKFIEHVEQQDLNALYCSAELFVFPSRNEGFGLPVVEAFASGVPVVTSNVASLPEIAGDAALTLDPEDTQALADAMTNVLSDRELYDELVVKGKARAAGFVWKKTAERTVDLYRELLATRS